MYRFLLTPRWLGLHLLVLLLIPAFLWLGQWQFGRYEERSDSAGRITANLAADPVPLETLVTVGGQVAEADRFHPVTVTGRYDAGQERLVRRRIQHGKVGYYVLTPLITGGGQAVLVNRGWVPAGATPDARPDVPPPPAGDVTVTGRLRPAETEESAGIKNRSGLPAGQILLINAETAAVPYPLYGGYVELTESNPAPASAPEPVPAPDVGAGGGLNLAYSVQWWLFIGIAVGGWALLIRREVKDRRAAQAKEERRRERADLAAG